MADDPRPPEPRPPHPRDLVCQAAGTELWEFVRQWDERHGLSDSEYLHLIGLMSGVRVKQMGAAERAAIEARAASPGGDPA